MIIKILLIVTAYLLTRMFNLRLLNLIVKHRTKTARILNRPYHSVTMKDGKIYDDYDEMNIGLSVFTWFPGVNVACLGIVFIIYLVFLIERIYVGISSGCENIRIYIFNRKIQIKLDFLARGVKNLYKFFVFSPK